MTVIVTPRGAPAKPVVKDDSATLTASLTHAALGGPAVTWQFRFEKTPDGAWKAVSYK